MNVEMTVTRKVADMGSGSNTSRDALPSPTAPCSGNEFFQAVSDCILPVKPHVQELKRRLLLFTLLLSWSCLGLTTLREDLFGFFVAAVPASRTTWMQQCWEILLISVQGLVAVGVWINIFQQLAADVAPQSGCGDGARRQVCPELVDRHVQTGQVADRQAQTVCKCLALEDQCHSRLSEHQQAEKSVLSAAVMRRQSEGEHDVEREVGLRADVGMTAESRLESPVYQPQLQTSSSSSSSSSASSSTQTLETSSVLEDATPRDDFNAITQDPVTDPTCRLPQDESCSSQRDIEENVVSSERNPKEVHVDVGRKQQRGKLSLDFMETSLQLARFTEQKKNPEHVKQEVEELRHKLALVKESSGKGRLMEELIAMHFRGRRQEQVFTCQRRLEGGGPHEELWREGNRLASFSMYALVPESGVWLMQLAAAGFYCPDKHSTVLRCAFCGVKVEIGHFRNRAPWEVHRALSPCCPLVKGEAQNQSLQEQTRTANCQYTKILASGSDLDPRARSHGGVGAEHNPSPDSGRQKAPEGDAIVSDCPPSTHLNCSGGCDSHPEAHRRGSASTTQSVPHQLGAAASRQASGSSGVPSSTSLPGGAHLNPSASSISTATSPAACPSTGAGRGDTAGDSVTPGGSVGDAAPPREQPRQAEGQVSSGASGAPPSSRSGAAGSSGNSQTSQPSYSAGGARNPSDPQTYRTVSTSSATVHPGNPQPFQTARVEERSQERTEPGAASHTAAATAAAAATTTTATTTASSPSSSSSSSSTTGNEAVRQVVTYAQLGIYTQEPKRPDMAIASARVRTYSDWPLPDSHPAEHMADAGFYYVGMDDLVRCFYCKGGLKSWSTSLQPWVEHARFYPECPFVGQVKGQEFIEAVQHLKEKQRDISEADVEEELQKRQSGVLGKGSASEDGAVAAEGRMKRSDGGAEGVMPKERTAGNSMADDENGCQADDTHLQRNADDLETENQEIKNERMCKICQVNDVSILFLPCGHLVSCSHCAPALRTCAVCRQRVKGRVRVSDDNTDFKEVKTDTEMETPAGDLLFKG